MSEPKRADEPDTNERENSSPAYVMGEKSEKSESSAGVRRARLWVVTDSTQAARKLRNSDTVD